MHEQPKTSLIDSMILFIIAFTPRSHNCCFQDLKQGAISLSTKRALGVLLLWTRPYTVKLSPSIILHRSSSNKGYQQNQQMKSLSSCMAQRMLLRDSSNTIPSLHPPWPTPCLLFLLCYINTILGCVPGNLLCFSEKASNSEDQASQIPMKTNERHKPMNKSVENAYYSG